MQAIFLSPMSPEFARKRAAGMELIRNYHGPLKPRSDGPPWHHLDRVSKLLELVLEEAAEGAPDERETIALSALGHDALEDTPVTKEELVAVFGARGLTLIEGMTNLLGDDHPTEYVAQVAASEEAVRLIKLSDLYDNCTSVTFNITKLGVEWTESYFLPIVTPMIAAVTATDFPTYPKAGTRLKQMVKTTFAVLLESVARQKTT
jgi:(p)ppGpp synthase/HD superfamily hydrolase